MLLISPDVARRSFTSGDPGCAVRGGQPAVLPSIVVKFAGSSALPRAFSRHRVPEFRNLFEHSQLLSRWNFARCVGLRRFTVVSFVEMAIEQQVLWGNIEMSEKLVETVLNPSTFSRDTELTGVLCGITRTVNKQTVPQWQASSSDQLHRFNKYDRQLQFLFKTRNKVARFALSG